MKLTNDVHNSSEGTGTDWNHDRISSIFDLLTSDETISTVQGNGSNSGVTQMLSDFEDESVLGASDFKGIKNGRKFTFELDIDDGTNDLSHLTHSLGEAGLALLGEI